MKNMSGPYLIWALQKTSQYLGFWGLLAITLLLASGFLFTAKVLPMQQEIIFLNESLKHHARNIEPVQPNVDKPKNNTAAQIAMFYGRFPDVATLPNWLEVIDETAISQQLALNRGDYKLNKVNKTSTNIKNNHLTRYEIMLPVKGSYIQIRKFIALILQKLPMLALSDFQITRENVGDSLVEARLLFVLFLKERS